MHPTQIAIDGGGAARQIDAALEDLSEIASRTLQRLATQARGDHRQMTGARVPRAAFGSDPRAGSLGASASAAHDVFVATVTGVQEVLEQYRDNLLAVVEQYRDADDTSEQELMRQFRERNEQTIRTRTDYDGNVEHLDIREQEQREWGEHEEVLATDDPPAGPNLRTTAPPPAASETPSLTPPGEGYEQ